MVLDAENGSLGLLTISPLPLASRNFSGGELQRISLARPFLHEPQIVLIDEGTSAVDAETESFIKLAIETEFAGRTVIIIA